MRLLFTPLLIIISLFTTAQVSIKGKVTDPAGLPISGASISIKGSYDGATTDSAGHFSFKTFEKGIQVLSISFIGYKPTELSISLDKDHKDLGVVLKEEITELKAVILSAGSFEASDRKRTTVLNTIDMLTTAGSNADVNAAIKTLPGAQQVGESEGLFVRGGTSAETRTYIDGNLVNNFFYSSVPNIAQRGRFSSFIFKGTVFSTGGYSAQYGQALSSVLLLETIDLPEQSVGAIGISVLGGSAGMQLLSKNKKSSWGFNYGYTNLWLAFKAIKQKQDFFDIPAYHTGDINFRVRTSQTGMIKYYGYLSTNMLGFRTNSIDTMGYKDVFSIKNVNMFHNLSWKENIGRRWKINAGLSFSKNRDEISSGLQDQKNMDVFLDELEFKTFSVKARGNYLNARLVFENKWKGLSAFRTGIEYNYSKDHSTYDPYIGLTQQKSITEAITAIFAETDIYLTNNLAAKFGTRFENSTLLNRSNIAPRISLAYKTGKESQASLAYGIFYQDPERRYFPAAYQPRFPRAEHYILQYQKLAGKTSFRAELFYKNYGQLPKTSVVNGQSSIQSNDGSGYAKGFEIFWRDRKTIHNFDYWISYSFLDTKRNFLNYPGMITPNFAAKHTASLIMKKFVTSIKTGFNLSYTYASSRPYYRIENFAGTNKFTDKGKTPTYNNISFSLNYLPKLFSKGAGKYTVFVLSVNNILGIKQTFGYNYSNNGYRKEPITPPARTFIFLGAFINFGVDKTDDIINNNL